METKYGFTLFKTPEEFKTWLDKQYLHRTINFVQIHHTATRISSFNGKNHFEEQKSMQDYHVKTNGWSDIAQQFTIFPDGSIMTGRSLDTIPAGIYGKNTGGICIENLGWYDKGYDEMPAAMKDAIPKYVKVILDKFKLTPSKASIVYHCWYDSKGTYLMDYVPGKSCKTCPGTNFYGGNTMSAFEKNFLPLVKAYNSSNTQKTTTNKKTTNTTKKKYTGVIPTALVVKGCRGTTVKRVQEFLRWYGFKLEADGIYGNITASAVTEFQKKVGFTGKDVDGKWGPKTASKAKTVTK